MKYEPYPFAKDWSWCRSKRVQGGPNQEQLPPAIFDKLEDGVPTTSGNTLNYKDRGKAMADLDKALKGGECDNVT